MQGKPPAAVGVAAEKNLTNISLTLTAKGKLSTIGMDNAANNNSNPFKFPIFFVLF